MPSLVNLLTADCRASASIVAKTKLSNSIACSIIITSRARRAFSNNALASRKVPISGDGSR